MTDETARQIDAPSRDTDPLFVELAAIDRRVGILRCECCGLVLLDTRPAEVRDADEK